MVRIRLPSGNIREFSGSDELAQAIAAGEITSDAEIFHAKSGRWVSITGHPIFRRTKVAPSPPPEPVPPPLPEEPTVTRAPDPVGGPAEIPNVLRDPEPENAAEPELPAAATSRALDPAPVPAQTAPPSTRPEPDSRASTPAAPPPSETGPVPPSRRGAAVPPPVHVPPPVLEMQSKSGQELAARRRAAWRLPAAAVVLTTVLAGLLWMNRDRGQDAPVPATRPTAVTRRPASQPPIIVSRDTGPSPAATVNRAVTAVEPLVLAGNHALRSDSLDRELAVAARQSGLNGFLETARLASDDSVQASRAALSRLVSSMTRYRARQQDLSKAYNDSADALALSGTWDRGALREWQVRVRRPEPPAVAARADALIAGLDSVLGLLHEYRGAYDITADQIRFKAPRASLQYDELLRGVNSNRVSQSEQISAPLSVLAEAMGGKRFPPSAHD
jgi:hypothetical protein